MHIVDNIAMLLVQISVDERRCRGSRQTTLPNNADSSIGEILSYISNQNSDEVMIEASVSVAMQLATGNFSHHLERQGNLLNRSIPVPSTVG